MNTPRNKTILLIDDDPLVNLVNKVIIERRSTFTVMAFTKAWEALAQLKHWSTAEADQFPDIIFLDINMPQMDGWDFLEEYQHLPDTLLEHCSVIMLTSSIDVEDIEKSRTYKPVRDFISKPLTSDKFFSALALVNNDGNEIE